VTEPTRAEIRAEQAAERRRVRDEENARIALLRDEGERIKLAKRNGEVPPAPEPTPEPVTVAEAPSDWESSEESQAEDFSAEPDYESDGGQ
jgi:hypothetical protein